MPGPCLKNETCFLRFPELQLRRTAKRSFKRECAGASQLFPVFPTPNQLINRVQMLCCFEHCHRRRFLHEEMTARDLFQRLLRRTETQFGAKLTHGRFDIPLPPFSITRGTPKLRNFFVEFPSKNQEWPFGLPGAGGTPTTRARVFGSLRHCYKPWSSLGWEKCWESVHWWFSKQQKYCCNGTLAVSGMTIIMIMNYHITMILLVMAPWLRNFCLNTAHSAWSPMPVWDGPAV